MLFSSLHVAL